MADLDPCAPLCLCGIRGCPDIDIHSTALIAKIPRFRMKSGGSRRHRRKR